MRALKVYENSIVKVEDAIDPVVGINDVKVKVKACGICGSDIPRVLDSKAHFYPIILGHEFSGIVAEIGNNVKNVNVGDRVVGVPLIPCYKCIDCINGDYSLCKNYKFIGSRVNGAMAEYVVIPKTNIVKIGAELSYDDAALVEPLSVVFHALKQNKHIPNKKVAILGMGTIGCLTAQVVNHIGAQNITVLVRNNNYDSLAQKMGISNIVNTTDSKWLDKVSQITQNCGFDFIYETAGSIETMKQAFDIAANKAHICYIGTPKKDISFSVKQWELINRKEFYLTGSWMSYSKQFPGDEWIDSIRYLTKGFVQIYPEMIYKKVPLEISGSVFENYKMNNVKGRIIIVN